MQRACDRKNTLHELLAGTRNLWEDGERACLSDAGYAFYEPKWRWLTRCCSKIIALSPDSNRPAAIFLLRSAIRSDESLANPLVRVVESNHDTFLDSILST
jgi:hypothetical protein